MTIAQWTTIIMEWCERKGWNKDPEGRELVLGNMISNLHSEVSEAWEEIRNGKAPNHVYYTVNGRPATTQELIQDIAKPEGFPIELADLAIRLFHICGHYNIDLEAMIRVKMLYNETRPYRHGGKTA